MEKAKEPVLNLDAEEFNTQQTDLSYNAFDYGESALVPTAAWNALWDELYHWRSGVFSRRMAENQAVDDQKLHKQVISIRYEMDNVKNELALARGKSLANMKFHERLHLDVEELNTRLASFETRDTPGEIKPNLETSIVGLSDASSALVDRVSKLEQIGMEFTTLAPLIVEHDKSRLAFEGGFGSLGKFVVQPAEKIDEMELDKNAVTQDVSSEIPSLHDSRNMTLQRSMERQMPTHDFLKVSASINASHPHIINSRPVLADDRDQSVDLPRLMERCIWQVVLNQMQQICSTEISN